VAVIHKVVSDYKARIHIEGAGDVERRLQVTPDIAGWDLLFFRTYTYRAGMVINGESAAEEMVMVLLSGNVNMEVNGQKWALTGRHTVFNGPPHTIYLPPGCDYRMTVLTDSDCAYSRAPADGRLPPRWIPPEALKIETIGTGLYEYQVTHILDAGDAEKLRCQEFRVPAGHWTEAPARRYVAADGKPINAIAYYRFQPSNGWGFTRVYDPATSQDEALLAKHGDAVIIRGGAHPGVASPESNMYVLNFMASTDPDWKVEPVVDPVHCEE
jgi:5-deoxy-glucuronate isomerase